MCHLVHVVVYPCHSVSINRMVRQGKKSLNYCFRFRISSAVDNMVPLVFRYGGLLDVHVDTEI